jgi:hypothetical protein
MFPKVTGVLEQECVCVPEGSTLKGINGKIGIQSFTEHFDQALYGLIHWISNFTLPFFLRLDVNLGAN